MSDAPQAPELISSKMLHSYYFDLQAPNLNIQTLQIQIHIKNINYIKDPKITKIKLMGMTPPSL